jgi:hypothetical protein
MTSRCVQPELLDGLPTDHPDAIHNRRDLRFINAIMGNYRWFARKLSENVLPGDRLLELGAGEGDLARHVFSQLNGAAPAYAALDLWPRPTDWPAAREWNRGDLTQFSDYAKYNVIVGNLILHQFTDDQLVQLGHIWRESARLLIFCEPARHPLHLAQLPLARLAGINHVTRHDARVSIEGGFAGRELPQLLGVDEAPWRVKLQHTFFGAYRMIAVRE